MNKLKEFQDMQAKCEYGSIEWFVIEFLIRGFVDGGTYLDGYLYWTGILLNNPGIDYEEKSNYQLVKMRKLYFAYLLVTQ